MSIKGIVCLLFVFVSDANSQGCPSGWSLVNNTCLQYNGGTTMTKYKGMNYCNSMGANLIAITSSSQSGQVKGWVESQKIKVDIWHNGKVQVDKSIYLDDGTKATYYKWFYKQPTLYSTDNGNDCARILYATHTGTPYKGRHYHGFWEDMDCNNATANAVICQMATSNSITAVTTKSPGKPITFIQSFTIKVTPKPYTDNRFNMGKPGGLGFNRGNGANNFGNKYNNGLAAKYMRPNNPFNQNITSGNVTTGAKGDAFKGHMGKGFNMPTSSSYNSSNYANPGIGFNKPDGNPGQGNTGGNPGQSNTGGNYGATINNPAIPGPMKKKNN